jgi:DNA-binding transcriptional MerR regulator
MKIKEVIAQTDLTDRAIRLYIENGLVSPSFNENYKGRKNIDFSQEDVENLKILPP